MFPLTVTTISSKGLRNSILQYSRIRTSSLFTDFQFPSLLLPLLEKLKSLERKFKKRFPFSQSLKHSLHTWGTGSKTLMYNKIQNQYPRVIAASTPICLYTSNYLGRGRDGSINKVLTLQAQRLSSTPRIQVKTPDILGGICNPNMGGTDRGSLKITEQPV